MYNENITSKKIHHINSYLYKHNINIPKTQKSLFISACLLALKIEPKILDIYDKHNEFGLANYIYELIKNKYNDNVFSNQFTFIKNSVNNKYLYQIIIMIISDINISKSEDILNKFYSEFYAYDKNNEPSLGVVLTPEDIVHLIVSTLDISKNDIVLDFCMGTGSFLIAAGKYTNNLYGCENNEERYTLAKCNFILHNYNEKYLEYKSCFNVNYKSNSINKITINPPFSCNCLDEENSNCIINWKKFTNERKYVIYALDLLVPGGITAAIIPRSNFKSTNKKEIISFKKTLLKHSIILKMINLNNKVFSPAASVETTIIFFQKSIKIKRNYLTKIIDYTNDGYLIKKKMRIKYTNPNMLNIEEKILTENNDWNFSKNNINHGFDNSLQTELELRIFDAKYAKKRLNLMMNFNEKYNLYNDNLKEVKLSEILYPIKYKSYSTDKTTNGKIPLYGATQMDIPVKMVNELSIDTNDFDDEITKENGLLCINKTGDGGAGYCFIRKGKFTVNSSVGIYKMKNKISEENCAFMGIQLHDILNRANSLTSTKFNEISVKLMISY